MDPNQVMSDLIDAVKHGDFFTARALAHSLHTWLASGAFYPSGCSREQTDELVAALLRLPADYDRTTTFSLCCVRCDAGMEIETLEQAVQSGWTDITLAVDLLQANFVGTCPDCKELG